MFLVPRVILSLRPPKSSVHVAFNFHFIPGADYFYRECTMLGTMFIKSVHTTSRALLFFFFFTNNNLDVNRINKAQSCMDFWRIVDPGPPQAELVGESISCVAEKREAQMFLHLFHPVTAPPVKEALQSHFQIWTSIFICMLCCHKASGTGTCLHLGNIGLDHPPP